MQPAKYKTVYLYGKRPRLATATANRKALSFAYNESGIRTQKTVDGVTTEYYLDGSTVLAKKPGTTPFGIITIATAPARLWNTAGRFTITFTTPKAMLWRCTITI